MWNKTGEIEGVFFAPLFCCGDVPGFAAGRNNEREQRNAHKGCSAHRSRVASYRTRMIPMYG
jgi:hypothetical protein